MIRLSLHSHGCLLFGRFEQYSYPVVKQESFVWFIRRPLNAHPVTRDMALSLLRNKLLVRPNFVPTIVQCYTLHCGRHECKL